MDEKNREIHLQLQREKRLNGLFFGFIAGLGLGVGIWAFDAFLLAQANSDYVWLKFLLGLPFLMLLGGLAGWITARFDKAIIGALVWLLTGLAVVWIASHIPFEGLSLAISALEPEFADLEIYPFVESARFRMSLLYLVVGALMSLGGVFEMFIVEAATRASSLLGRFFSLLTCMVIFIPIGLAVDNLINSPLREAVAGVNDLIQFGRKAEVAPMSLEERRALGLTKLRSLGDLIHRPYRVILGSYDPETLSETTVYLDFDGDWAMCTAYGNQPMNCQLSSVRYLTRFACLAASGEAKSCKIKALPEAEAQAEAVRRQIQGEFVEYGVIGQRGSAVILAAETDQGDQFRCVFRELGDVVLDSCERTQDRAYDAIALPATSTPRAASPATALPPSAAAPSQQAALIATEELDLPALQGIPRYDIVLTIDQSLRSFQGRARVKYTNREEVPLEALYFRLLPNGQGSYGNGSLEVSQTWVNGEPADSQLSEGETVIKVPLPTPLQPGGKRTLEFDFMGVVPEDFGGSATPAGYGIYNYSDGVLALSGWYPILSVYDESGWNLDAPSWLGDSVFSETAFYTVDITFPTGLVLAATGVQTESQPEGEFTRLRYESGPVRDFFLVAGPDFQSASQSIGGTLVSSYFLPGYEQAGRKALSVAARSLEIFNQEFGPYPFTEVDVVQAPMRNVAGVEFPGIMLVGASLYDSPDKPEFEITTAHEIAHQWWYSVVGNDVFEEPWLDEALSTYSSSLFYEFESGPDYVQGLQAHWQERYDKLVDAGKDELVTEDLEYFESLGDPSVYGGIVYTKGALFFEALRQEIGDQAFFQALQEYYRERYYLVARAEHLLDTFERAAGRQLDDLYQEWLYSKQ